MRNIKKFMSILLIGLFLFGICQLGWAQKWQPYQFRGNERFEYKILWEEDKMLAEWIIDPELALPLRSMIFEDNELQGQIELIKYVQY